LLKDAQFSNSTNPSLQVVQCLVEANPESLSCQTMDGDLPITLAGRPVAMDISYFFLRRFPDVVNAAIKK